MSSRRVLPLFVFTPGSAPAFSNGFHHGWVVVPLRRYVQGGQSRRVKEAPFSPRLRVPLERGSNIRGAYILNYSGQVGDGWL